VRDHTYKMGAKAIRGDLQRLFNLCLALTMECLHTAAIGLCAHLEFIIINEQNNDRVIACQLLQMAMATSHGI
jgi:hypothetical protein